jgi:SWI/SNF-related matrix-associated actin-dependent regulator 1 of chromatin subfamily A
LSAPARRIKEAAVVVVVVAAVAVAEAAAVAVAAAEAAAVAEAEAEAAAEAAAGGGAMVAMSVVMVVVLRAVGQATIHVAMVAAKDVTERIEVGAPVEKHTLLRITAAARVAGGARHCQL